MTIPIEILEKMETISARIAAVALDLDSGADRFAKVDPYKLAELLGLQPENFESRSKYGCRVSLDDYCDPIHCFIAPLKGTVTEARIKEITEQSKAFEAGDATSDAELTLSEKKTIEDYLTQLDLADGGGWIVATETIYSSTGIELEFEAEIGDGGECFGCYGPYQIRDGRGMNFDDLVECESW